MSVLKRKLIKIIVEVPVKIIDYSLLLGIEFIHCLIQIRRILFDNKNGININDCASIGHQINAILNIENPIISTYTLVGSSPGLDHLLFIIEYYINLIGKKLILFYMIQLQKIAVNGKDLLRLLIAI